MKKVIYTILILCALLTFGSCEKKNYYYPDETEPITTADYEYIQLSKTELSMETGGYTTLEAVPYPDSDAKITLSSSDRSIADIDKYGNILALSEGKAIITAKSEDGAKAQCKITVNGLRCMQISSDAPANAGDEEQFSISVSFDHCIYPTIKIIPECKSGTVTSVDKTVTFTGSNKQLFAVGETKISFVVDGSRDINSIRIIGFDKGEMIDAKEITIAPPLPDYDALKNRINVLEDKVADLTDQLDALKD